MTAKSDGAGAPEQKQPLHRSEMLANYRGITLLDLARFAAKASAVAEGERARYE